MPGPTCATRTTPNFGRQPKSLVLCRAMQVTVSPTFCRLASRPATRRWLLLKKSWLSLRKTAWLFLRLGHTQLVPLDGRRRRPLQR